MSPSNSRRGLYRSRKGAIMGVCTGLARYFDFNVTVIRGLAILLFLFTGLWPAVGIYVLMAMLMKPEPVLPFADNAEREFYDSYAATRKTALLKLKRKFNSLDSRVRFMEDIVTSRDFEWEKKLHGHEGET